MAQNRGSNVAFINGSMMAIRAFAADTMVIEVDNILG
jgi:hypothetical protein